MTIWSILKELGLPRTLQLSPCTSVTLPWAQPTRFSSPPPWKLFSVRGAASSITRRSHWYGYEFIDVPTTCQVCGWDITGPELRHRVLQFKMRNSGTESFSLKQLCFKLQDSVPEFRILNFRTQCLSSGPVLSGPLRCQVVGTAMNS